MIFKGRIGDLAVYSVIYEYGKTVLFRLSVIKCYVVIARFLNVKPVAFTDT